jgi:hypothetical protein
MIDTREIYAKNLRANFWHKFPGYTITNKKEAPHRK